MPGKPMRTNLGEWANKPTIQDQVIAYMEERGCSLLLREIYYPLRLPRWTVNRVLGRLHAKGIVTRHKIPVQRHLPARQSRSIMAEGATRQCYLYRFADETGGSL